MNEQLSHNDAFIQQKNNPIIVVCDRIYFQQNIGSIFRLCDAFGVEKVIFTGEQFLLSERKVNKTSRNTHKTVPFEIIKEQNELISFLKETKRRILALEISTESIALEKIEILEIEPLVLLLGSELYGLSKEVLQTASETVHINMYGANSSMNVTHALAIALHTITQKL